MHAIGRGVKWVAAAAASAGLAAGGWYVASPARAPAPVLPTGVAQRAAHQQCVEAAMLVHDVRWAAACTALGQQGQGDGVADCDLPDAQAGKLYQLLQEAERSCLAEAVANAPS